MESNGWVATSRSIRLRKGLQVTGLLSDVEVEGDMDVAGVTTERVEVEGMRGARVGMEERDEDMEGEVEEEEGEVGEGDMDEEGVMRKEDTNYLPFGWCETSLRPANSLILCFPF